MTATQEPTAKAPAQESVRVRQFDADRHDQSLALDDALEAKPTERQLLWIDISEELDAGQARRLADAFELDPSTVHALTNPGDVPHLGVHGSYLHIRVAVEPNDREPDATPWLDIVGGGNVVITSHRKPIQLLDDMDDRIQADTTFGLLDASTFIASLLGAAVTTYFTAVDAIEDDVDCSTRSRSATTAGTSSSTTSWWCGDGSPVFAGSSPITARCSRPSPGRSWRS